MAAAVYYSWDRLGRPVTPSQPIRDYVTRLKATFPAASSLFGWYANEAHYTANPPQDHTPFSATGWPLASPQWFVFATDVMHRPDLGVDCNVLFPYWLAEAKAGRTPWVKYLIWQAKLYDVRNGWMPQANSGHFDHIHISVRTDWQNRGLGLWSLLPGAQEDDMPKFWRLPNGAVGCTTGPWRYGYATTSQLDAALAVWGLDRKALVPVAAEQVAALGQLANDVGHTEVVLTPEQLDELAKDFAAAIDVPTTGEIADAVNDDAAERLKD